MEQPLYSPVSPQVVNYDMNGYYSGQTFITPVSPYESRPEYERESVFSELRAVDSIIDSTVSVLRQFDTLTSNSTTHRQSTSSISSISDTYSMTSTDSVTSACAYVPPPQVMDMSMTARGTPSPSSPLAPTTPSSVTSFDDLAPSPRKRFNPYSSKSKKKYIARGTKEYSEKRERNNVAVRKSRAKAKNRQKDNERRMCELQMENERLTEKLEGISKELVVLKGLFKNMGATVPAGFSKLFQS
ncbi:hypothetical protein SNE40_007655 [Patella caerulea]|uniref:BZIP domain-containing protein n=1 Tax=Patella caerulea TaxID=87958 RepID=A0AAN8PVB9_PATCE